MEPQKLKRVIIKQELVELTGNYVDAILLNQLLYWSERVKDFDLFLKQEAELEGREPDKCYFGWVYKSYEALSKETMLGLSPSNIKKHIENLHKAGFIEIRQNKNKWDRRKEYKINLKYIQNELILKGYSLEGYTLGTTFSKTENGSSNLENGFSKTENRTAQNRKTVTEITTEITTEKKKARKKISVDYDEILDSIENVKLKNAYYDFIKMRKLIKSPLTNRALTMLIDKVNTLTSDDDVKVKVLEQSILNNWKSVYPLKGDFNNNNSGVIDSNSIVDETKRMLNERRKERGEING